MITGPLTGQSIGDVKSKESLQKFVRRSRNRRSLRQSRTEWRSSWRGSPPFSSPFSRWRGYVQGPDESRSPGTTRYSAQQVIVVSGISEGGVEPVSSDLSVLHDRLPYIKSAKVSRKLPYTITMTVSEDSAGYYCELYGEYSRFPRISGVERADSDERLFRTVMSA